MALPVPSALAQHDRLWPAIFASLAVHAALAVVAVVRRQPAIDLDQKPIVARLVRLGEKRPEEYLPRKEAEPPPPAPQPVSPPAPVPNAQSAPMTAPGKTAPKEAAPRPPARDGAPGGSSSLANVLSRVRKQVDADKRWGDPSGDAMGDSSEGSEGDRYLALVDRAIRANYRVPATISDRDRMYLKAVIVLYIEADGGLRRWSFAKRSGSPAFDDALERTLQQSRFPPPPDDLRESYRRTGVQVTFKLTN
jgi:colicin import membrane protein/protein TonB